MGYTPSAKTFIVIAVLVSLLFLEIFLVIYILIKPCGYIAGGVVGLTISCN